MHLFRTFSISQNCLFSFHIRNVSNSCRSLIYEEYGDPLEVVKCRTKSKFLENKLKSEELILKVLASPINPADINMIQGTYAVKPNFPAVGGNEGICQVIEVGSKVDQVKAGCWVIPKIPASTKFGMWTEYIKCDQNEVFQVANDLPIEGAATMAVNPCTAYRMIKDFVNLGEGDTIIQNAANSGVGIAAIQIANNFRLKTINIIRDRNDQQKLKEYLKSLGATYVFTDTELKEENTKKLMKEMPKAKLALNAVGGKATIELCKHMSTNAAMIVYGGMSRQPLAVPIGSLIFSDITIKGYWMTRWVQQNYSSQERRYMMDYVSDLIRYKQLLPPICQRHSIDNYQNALTNAMQPFTSTKQLFVFHSEYL